MRDFIHIEDCVTGVLTTKDQIRNGAAVNLSTGVFTSFIALARQVAQQVGYSPEVAGMSDKPEGVFARGGDTALQRRMGFLPSLRLDAGISLSLAYFESLAANTKARAASAT